MSLPSRIKNIAISQLHAITERLERIELETASETFDRKIAESDARDEVMNAMEPGAVRRRSPEEIASGSVSRPRPVVASPSPAPSKASNAPVRNESILAGHYRVMGLAEGADFAAVQQAYSHLIARCSPERFDEGSAEQSTAAEIRKRVQVSYDALREVLDSTTGRFDKLEL